MDLQSFLDVQQWLIALPSAEKLPEEFFCGSCSFAFKGDLKDPRLITINQKDKFNLRLFAHTLCSKNVLVLGIEKYNYILDSSFSVEQFLKIKPHDERPPTLALEFEFIQLLIYPNSSKFTTFNSGTKYLCQALEQIRLWIKNEKFSNDVNCDIAESAFSWTRLLESVEMLKFDMQRLETSAVSTFAKEYLNYKNYKVMDRPDINLLAEMKNALQNINSDTIQNVEEKVISCMTECFQQNLDLILTDLDKIR